MASNKLEIGVRIVPDRAFKLIKWVLRRRREEHAAWFFLGWCAGLLTALLMLASVKALGCDEPPAPDGTIGQIKVRAI